MSLDRYDAVVIRSYVNRDGEEKTAFTKIGTAFPYRNGDGFMITFDALPVPALDQESGELRCVVHLREPYDPDRQQGGRSGGRERGGGRGPSRDARGGGSRAGGAARGRDRRDEGLDDEIPF